MIKILEKRLFQNIFRKCKSTVSFIFLLSTIITVQAGNPQLSQLREKWTQLLIGDDNLNISDPIVSAYITDIEAKANVVWNEMVKKPVGVDSRTYIFADLPMTSLDRTGTSQITFTYDRLKMLTLAYKLPGTEFTGRQDVFDEIIAALDLMVENYYSVANATKGTGTDATGTYGNWYDWRIGTPLRYNDLLFMLADKLTTEQIERYISPVLANNKAVDTTGANRTWIAGIVAQAGILLGRENMVVMAKDGLKDIFRYVTSGDGYYRDGSFVQHGNYAYTGGYGKALLCTISPLMYILKDTEWEISYPDNAEQVFYDMLFLAYEPLIYDGRFMDMAREREISRLANQDHIPGRQAIRAIILLLDVLEGEQKERARRMVKQWLNDIEVLMQVCSEPNDGFLEYVLSVVMLTKALDIAHDNSISPRGDLILHRRFSSMDRVVHLRKDYALGLSMTSPRIKNTEGTNDEGLRLWHIGDGMLYLYNEDKDLFADNFWATVDYQRLPGTTVTRVDRGIKEGYKTFNPNTWVGGTDLDGYGVVGMQFSGMGTDASRTLEAKKSWFMFDDEIVSLGSGITLTSGSAPVETIIENRKIKRDLSNQLTVNGKLITTSTLQHTDVEWIHLEGSKGQKTDVGYYFPNKSTVRTLRETRTGSWELVNTYFKFSDNKPRTNNFVTFWFEHGNTPRNESYAYVLLPGKTVTATKEYNKNPDIEILQQDNKMHAVRENKLAITAVNFWSAGNFGKFTVNGSASLMIREHENSITLSVSDPTQTHSVLYVDFSDITYADVVLSEGVTLKGNRLTINTQDARGKSFYATFK